MDGRVDDALADVLARIDTGGEVTAVWLRERYPDCWREILEALEVDSAVGEAAPPPATLGPYRVLKPLGRGGMGAVYLAEVAGGAYGLAPGTRVALKIVHPRFVTPGFSRRLRREAEIGTQIRHANVVRTFGLEALPAGGRVHHCLVMDYVEGQTLRALLATLYRVPEEMCRHVGREIARGLAAIHAAGAVHRDLKPENVLVAADGAVKVMDLGVARLSGGAARISRTGAFVGSMPYAAPEQFAGRDAGIDGRADLYATGLVLYELATGRHPFADDDVRVLVRRQLDSVPARASDVEPSVTPFLDEVLATLLAKDPGARFASAQELLGVLEGGESSAWWKVRAAQGRGADGPPRRMRVRRETPIVGRERELALLRGLFADAASGAGRVVLVEGEAGVGKSRLVDEFVAGLRDRGEDVAFLWGSYPPGGVSGEGSAFVAAIRDHVDAASLTDALAPSLAAALSSALDEPSAQARRRADRDALEAAFVEVVRALVVVRSTVFLIDDLYFASVTGRALFVAIAHAVAGSRALLVGAARPGLPADWVAATMRDEHARRIALGRLPREHTVALLAGALRSVPLAHELAPLVATGSDGNPFFALEILRGLMEAGLVRRRPDGTCERAGEVEGLAVPPTLLDLLRSRLADMSDEDREVLDAAACCGFEFDADLVADALDAPPIRVLRRLAEMERFRGIVRCTGRRFAFDHHLLHEVIESGLSEPLREEYHRRLAETLERREAAGRDPSSVGGAVAAALCGHFLRGARPERARPYLQAALHHVELAELYAETVALTERALAAGEILDVRARADVVLRRATALHMLGRRDEESAAIREGLALVENSGDLSLSARAHLDLGRYLAAIGRRREGAEAGARALEFSLAAGDRGRQAQAHTLLAIASREAGRLDEARGHHEEQIRLAAELGDRVNETMGLGNLGHVLRSLGRVDEANRCFERQLALSLEIGNRRGQALALMGLGIQHSDDRRPRGALECFERALVLFRDLGHRHGALRTHENLGLLHTLLGDPVRAADHLDAALAEVQTLGDPHERGRVLQMFGWLADCQGDDDGAMLRYAEAMQDMRDTRQLPLLACTLLFVGALHLRAGRTHEARTAFDEALESAGGGDAAELALLARAHIALLVPETAAAVAAAVDADEPHLVASERMEIRHVLHRATGERAHVDEAHRLLVEFQEHAPPASRATLVENVRLHREIREAWESARR